MAGDFPSDSAHAVLSELDDQMASLTLTSADDEWACGRCGVSVRVGSKDCDLCVGRNARRNAVAAALMTAHGWLSLRVRYTAAEAALRVVEDDLWPKERGARA